MPLWGKADQANNSPKFTPLLVNKAANTANRDALYGNTSVGVFGVDAAEIGVNKKIAHTGWMLRKVGTGGVATIVINSGGSGYANTDLVRVSGPGTNAAGTIVTNANGTITAVTVTNSGSGFVATNPTVAVTNATSGTSAGSSANLSAVMNGRVGRVSTEVLVAGGITGDGSDDTTFPDA